MLQAFLSFMKITNLGNKNTIYYVLDIEREHFLKAIMKNG